MNEVLAKAAQLAAARRPHALVTVVWSAAPSSGKAGYKAVVTGDGEMFGWIGGACSQPAVLRECRRAIAEGTPRVLCLGDDAHFPPPGVGRLHQPITCTSEGALEIFIDPQLPTAQVVVIGEAPVAVALAKMAEAVGFDVQSVGGDLDLGVVDDRTFVVVATMGQYDDEALRAALATKAPYVGMVASSRRAASVLDLLARQGVSRDQLDRVHAPAGLDLGTLPQEEIAVAILAEIVKLKAAGLGVVTEAAPEPEVAVDPVCGMSVTVATARYRFVHEGTTYYFCCGGCLERFREEPGNYLKARAG